MIKKILFFSLFFCCTTFNLFSEEWKICLGSFKVYSNAESRVELLKEKAAITEKVLEAASAEDTAAE